MQTKQIITVSITPDILGVLNKWKEETPELSRSEIVRMLVMQMCDHKIKKVGWRHEFVKKNSNG